MPSRAEILDPEREHPFTVTASSGDRRTSVSSSVIRCIYDGQRAVAVGNDASAKTQIAALLDLLHLHYDGADEATPSVTNRDEVTIILGDHKNEAVDALCTLRDNVVGAPRVNIRVHEPAQPLSLIGRSTLDLADELNLYPGWSDLLTAVRQPPKLVETLAQSLNIAEVRAYPMLTARGTWSMRVEGLEIGRFRNRRGWLDVGKDAESGAQSEARRIWQRATGLSERYPVEEGNPESLAACVNLVRAFATAWLTSGGTTRIRQNEHALESRILRGNTRLRTSSNRVLELISGQHPIVNWGSQFPTKWGRQGAARYLDAILRDGGTPWAIEMKVAGSAGALTVHQTAPKPSARNPAHLSATRLTMLDCPDNRGRPHLRAHQGRPGRGTGPGQEGRPPAEGERPPGRADPADVRQSTPSRRSLTRSASPT